VERWGLDLSPVPDHDIPEQVLAYADELLKAPRHLGIHSGGMVLTERPVGEVVPSSTPDGEAHRHPVGQGRARGWGW
jgi:DNA polymerase III alpha subunit